MYQLVNFTSYFTIREKPYTNMMDQDYTITIAGKEHFNEILAINKVGFLSYYDDIRVRSNFYSELIFHLSGL